MKSMRELVESEIREEIREEFAKRDGGTVGADELRDWFKGETNIFGYEPRIEPSPEEIECKIQDKVERVLSWRLQALARRGVPRRALAAATTADHNAPAMVALSAWSPERNLLALAGPPGAGKTVAAVRWLFEHAGEEPRFLTAGELQVGGRYNHDLREQWAKATALVIDDLGMEFLDEKGVFAATLDELVNRFCESGAPLLITTNLRDTEFRDRYGARIASRWAGAGSWRNVVGPDLRRRQ